MKKGINKKYMSIGVVIIAVLLVIGGIFLFTQQSSGVKTITHEYFNFSIDSSWKETESMSAFVYTPNNNENKESITITSTSLGGFTFDLSLPFQQSLEGYKISMPDLLVGKTSEWDNGKISGKEIQFSGTRQGVKMNIDQIFSIKNGVLYSITYTCIDNCESSTVFEGVKESFEPLL